MDKAKKKFIEIVQPIECIGLLGKINNDVINKKFSSTAEALIFSPDVVDAYSDVPRMYSITLSFMLLSVINSIWPAMRSILPSCAELLKKQTSMSGLLSNWRYISFILPV